MGCPEPGTRPVPLAPVGPQHAQLEIASFHRYRDEMLRRITEKLAENARIDRNEAAFLFEQAPADELARLATSVRSRFHAPDEATYLIMAIVNYTNVCV